jgi:hypothetical protein
MRTTIDDLYVDIWLQIFEYFNATELFTSFTHVTRTVGEVLFNRNRHFRIRRFVVDVHMTSLPEKLPLNQVISLELHQESSVDIITQCLELRSLKLIGQSDWVMHLLEKVSYVNMRLEKLILVVPGVGLLYDMFSYISSILSLRRLEIHANDFEEKLKTSSGGYQ